MDLSIFTASLALGSSFSWALAPLALVGWVLKSHPHALSLDGAFYIAQSAFFRQSTSSWALALILLGFVAYRTGWGRPLALLGLAQPLAKPLARAWRRAYFFNKGLSNGLVLVHPLLVALAYASVACLYARRLGLCLPGRPAPASGLALFGAQASATALLLGSWWAQQELNWGGWWSWDLVELGSLGVLLLCARLLHSPESLSPAPGLALIFFYLGLRWGLFSSVHSFVVSGRGARQGASLLVFLSLAPLVLGSWPASSRAGLVSAALGGGLALVALVFVDDALGPLVGQSWLRPALWALLPLSVALSPGRSWLSPLPLCLSLLGRPEAPGGLRHFFLFLGLGVAGIAGSRYSQAELAPESLGLWVSLGESWLSCWSAPLSASSAASLGQLAYEHSLTRLNLGFLRRVGAADILQQSLLGVGGGVLALSSFTPLVEPLLGLGLGVGLLSLLARKAPSL